MPYGWTGKILRVNLSDGTTSTTDSMRYTPGFIGGKGVAIKIAWDELKGGIDPYHPDNIMVFMTGPLTGTLAPASGRGILCSVSPRVYPNPWYSRSNIGGYWAPELKYAGYDGLVVSGASEKPVYLLIRDGHVSLENAAELHGKGTFSTQRILKDLYGDEAQVLCIGPAGENRVRFSTIQHNLSNASGQLGFGAVMGAKRLKAIVIRGTGGVKVADPAGFMSACQYVEELVRNGPNIFHMLHSKVSPPDKVVCSAACPCNCEAIAKKKVPAKFGPGYLTMLEHCMYASTGWCRTEYKRPEVPEIRTEGTPGFGDHIDVQCIIEDLGVSLWEYFSFYPWLEVFVRNGITELKGLKLDINSSRFWYDFFQLVAHREGVGDILADSVLRASERLEDLGVPERHWDEIRRIARFLQPAYGFPAHRLGRAAESQPSPLWIFSMLHWAFDTRDPMSSHHQSSFLEYVFPPHHGVEKAAADVPFEKLKKTYGKLLGNGEVLEPGFGHIRDKVRCAIWHQHRSCVKDSLLLCDWLFPRTFASFKDQEELDKAFDISGDVDAEAKLFGPATGIRMSTEELETCGERIFNLERALHIRNYGRNRDVDETIKWYCELPEKTDGTRVDAETFRSILDVYYECRGWDGEQGIPRRGKLEELGLGDVAGDLRAPEK